ncbi:MULTISPECIES: glycosyltransferase family 2 protein [unclassified Ruegeria]|uniref:glycosyltransferase family 2 protein n=1 Tax=unclassified Ruegeria TaxID=2625375 RepID=UPI0014909DA3|nr:MULTISPECIES: glycosyltransferase family 2 protein [unclassified Ruegeria]NOD36580.1 glycosyltransferase [Ruegeria sp. HKCCD7296]NOE43820.1 glycosyltransferase [Ruegeria sp. HKCCD7319]
MEGTLAEVSNKPTVLSIIIVNWNTAKLLNDCLTSVFASYDSTFMEVIVIDNGSDDNSCDIVRKFFPNVILQQNTQNVGFAAANNQGFQLAKGRFVLLLNSDTLVHGDVLKKSVEWLDAHSDVAAMGCKVLNADGTTQLTCSQYPSILNLILLTSGLWKAPWPRFLGKFQLTYWNRDCEKDVEIISGCYFLIRKEVIDTVGSLDEEFFFYGEETDWCRRIRKAGWRLAFAPVGKITHFGGGSVKKLHYRKDIMLSESVVRLHKKHGGLLAAYSAYLILLTFNSSRALYWNIKYLVRNRNNSKDKATHFRKVLLHSKDIWPATKR